MERDQSSTVATSDAWKLPAAIAGGIILLFVIIAIVMVVKKKRNGKKEEVSSYAHSELGENDSKTADDTIKNINTASNAGIPEAGASSKPISNNAANPFATGRSSSLQDKLNGNSVIPKA